MLLRRTDVKLGLDNSSAKLFPKDTILMAMYGQGNTRGKVARLKIDAATNQACAAITLISSNSLEFIFQVLSYNYEILRNISNEGGQKNLSATLIRSFKIIIPISLSEQTKIANFLAAVDKRISLLKKKKEELRKYKKGIMQNLFSQKIRFKDENGNDYPDWEEKKLKDVLYEHKSKNDNKYTEVFSVSKSKGVVNQIEHLGRSYTANSIKHYKLIYPNDIVYTKSPTSDFPFGIIKQNQTERIGVLSPLYAVFSPSTPAIGAILHNYFLSWVNTYNYLVPLVQKGAKNTMNINNNDFLNGAKIFLPVHESEQQKIASFLSGIDMIIEKVGKQIDSTLEFKKGLLQKMFV